MKKFFCLMAAALMVSAATLAQPPQQDRRPDQQPKEMPTVEEMAKMKADRMKQQLLLGNDQYDKVYKLCLEQAGKELERMKQIRAEKEQMAEKMKGILNETQYERFEHMRHHRGRAFGKAPQDNEGKAPQRMGKGPKVPPQEGMRRNMHDDTRERPMMRRGDSGKAAENAGK